MLYKVFYEYCLNNPAFEVSQVNENSFKITPVTGENSLFFIQIFNSVEFIVINLILKKTIISKAPKIKHMLIDLSHQLNGNFSEDDRSYNLSKFTSSFDVSKNYLALLFNKLAYITGVIGYYFNVPNIDSPILKKNNIKLPKSSKISFRSLVVGRNTIFNGDLQTKFGYIFLGQFIAGGYNIKLIAGNHLTQLPNLQVSLQKTIDGGEHRCFFDMGYIDVGNNVWIGDNVVILKNVTIGDGAIIGSGAVVTHDVPPFAIVGGVPAKIIRYRFSKNVIEQMLKIQWWNWPMERILTEKRFFSTQIPADIDYDVLSLLTTNNP